MASVYRTFLEKLGGSAIGSFIGTKGDLFYDPEASPPELKVSDGVTAGGVSLPSGGGGGGQNNENSYKTIQVTEQDDVVAGTATDTLELAAGSNITITTDAINDKITFAATDTNTTYTVGDGGLTQNNLTNILKGYYDTAYGWGDHSGAGYLTSTGYNNTNWDTAYGWGNHSGAGYLSTTGVLSSHTDVHTTAATNGQVLKWDNENSRWEPGTDTDTTYTVGDGGLTQNNLTNILKGYYDTGYTHSQAAHAPAGAEVNQPAFKTIEVDGEDDVVANTDESILAFEAGSNMTITTNASSDMITFASTGGSGDAFTSIEVDGEDNVVADGTDTLSFEAGSNMTITTNATTDTVTFAAASASSSTAGDPMNLWIDGDFTQWLDGITAGSTSIAAIPDQTHTSTLIRYEQGGEGTPEYTASRSTDTPTVAESGHASAYSLKMTCSGDNGDEVGISDYTRLTYNVTGTDYAFIHGSEDIILSFWVRSSMTGTYTIGLKNHDVDRAMPIEYTINTADTWEKKNIAIETDNTTNPTDWKLDEEYSGLKIHFVLVAGEDFHGTNNTWGGDGYLYSTDQQVNHAGIQDGTFYISQIGLYKTDTAPASFVGDAIPVVKNKVGYYFRKSYRDFDKPGTSTQIGIITSMGEFDTSLGGVSNSRITNVTFGSRMRNLHDGSQPSIKLYDKVGNVDAITLWDMGTATDNVGTADYQYHCESGFQVKTDDSTGRNGMSFHYTSDCRHLGDESMM